MPSKTPKNRGLKPSSSESKSDRKPSAAELVGTDTKPVLDDQDQDHGSEFAPTASGSGSEEDDYTLHPMAYPDPDDSADGDFAGEDDIDDDDYGAGKKRKRGTGKPKPKSNSKPKTKSRTTNASPKRPRSSGGGGGGGTGHAWTGDEDWRLFKALHPRTPGGWGRASSEVGGGRDEKVSLGWWLAPVPACSSGGVCCPSTAVCVVCGSGSGVGLVVS
ncbi:uncharacterized protein EHS24_000775 [Apiotrichum porosum]|uniref:Myb-like domain-containing protein n=1 Tax=Apiotrichum porosum TaxID=105984 RepID=A0A427YAV3_9TREE|nr:uncharacterized protein EHS24_000775 [Apiotrichum porosum]RSH88243.1 hypothetical protein EHS24_000775 [Apiotrichum porosum]